MRLKFFILCSAISFYLQNTFAATTNGPYIGGQIGFGYLHQGDFLLREFNRLIHKIAPHQNADAFNIIFSNTGLGGRVFIGYQFNNYFALELGYYRFKTLNLNGNLTTNVHVNSELILQLLRRDSFSFPIYFNAKTSMTTYVVDLSAKGILPITANLNLYGKVGLAYIDADAHVSLSMNVNNIFDIGISANPSVNMVYPEFGVGISYDITEHANLDLSWIHIQKYNGKCFPNIDFVSTGLIYRF